jgi:hypothetical protein
MKPLIRTPILFFFLIFSTFGVAHAQNVSQDTSNSAKGFSWIDFFNNLAKAAKLSPLNQRTHINGQRIRLWVSFSHSLGAQLLDIRLSKEKTEVQWFVTWADWGDKNKRQKRAEQWPCKTKVNRVQIGEGMYTACKLKEASDSEITRIKNVLVESDITELSKISVEKRAQLDGKSLHIELVDSSGYYFQSFLNHHLDNHPKKKEMHNIRELVFSWRNNTNE